MNPDILIPSCKDEWELSKVIGDIMTVSRESQICYSCLKASASVNRNACLEMATSEYVVMADDDMTGFFYGWEQMMVQPLIDNPDIVYVSARLMDDVDLPQKAAMGYSPDLDTPLVRVPMAPSACVAFRNDGTRFCEQYIGSGFEDSDFLCQLLEKYKDGYVVVNNEVKLIHKHEMKHQSKNNDFNEGIFSQRFPSAHRLFVVRWK